MSVKVKVKRLNKQIKNLQEELQTYQLSNNRLKAKLEEQKSDKQYTEQLENIVKFALTNHIGNLRGGMRIDRYGIDKMKD